MKLKVIIACAAAAALFAAPAFSAEGLKGSFTNDSGKSFKIVSIASDGFIKGKVDDTAKKVKFTEIKKIEYDRSTRKHTVTTFDGKTLVFSGAMIQTTERTVNMDIEYIDEEGKTTSDSIYGGNIMAIEFEPAPAKQAEAKPAEEPKKEETAKDPAGAKAAAQAVEAPAAAPDEKPAEKPAARKNISDYNLNGAVAECKKAEEGAGELVKKYEEAKAAGKLLGKGGSDEFVWLEILGGMRNMHRQIVDYYQSAITDGWQTADPEMKSVEAKIDVLVKKFEPCGYWTCLNVTEKQMNEWADLDRLRAMALIASELSKNKGDMKVVKKLNDDIAVMLERMLKYSDAHEKDASVNQNSTIKLGEQPGFQRAKKEIDRLLSDCAAGLKAMSGAKDEALKQWTLIHKERERLSEFFNKMDGYQGFHPDSFPKIIEEIEAFEKKELGALREKLEKFAANYGTNEEELNRRVNEMFETDKPTDLMDPGYLYTQFSRGIENIGKARVETARSLADIVKSRFETAKSVAEDYRGKFYDEIREGIKLGLRYDPKNGDLQKAAADIDEIVGKDKAEAEKQMKEFQWPGNLKTFAGPGEPDALCKAALEYFNSTCKPNEHALAACIREDNWYVFKKNIFGEPIQYGLTFFVAVADDNDANKEMARVFSISFLTAEGPGVKKEPPFAAAAFNQQYKMLKANVPGAK